MKPEIIIMLTHHDVTVKNAAEVFEDCKDLNVKYWGFKNVGLPKDQMKSLADAMKKAGKTTFLEVVTYDEESCLDGAKTAIDCGFDYLMGTMYFDSVAKLLKENDIMYLPFVGKVSGSPSILEGTNEEIIEGAREMIKKGITGFDILAYRHVIDGEKLAYEFCEAVDAQICIAGSINSFARIDTMFKISPWTFTMGSALFEKAFVPGGSFRENLQAVVSYMEENCL
jgi:hypothetical protein